MEMKTNLMQILCIYMHTDVQYVMWFAMKLSTLFRFVCTWETLRNAAFKANGARHAIVTTGPLVENWRIIAR